MRVSVIIPTYNEAQAIGRVVGDLPSNLVTEVVVDSNSTDGTPDLAPRIGALVIQEARREYGRAWLTGLANAQNPDVVVFLDGDYSDLTAGRQQVIAFNSDSPHLAPSALESAFEILTGFTEPFYEVDVTNDLILLARQLRLASAKASKTAVWFGKCQQEIAFLRD